MGSNGPAPTKVKAPVFATVTIRPTNVKDDRRQYGIELPATGRVVFSSTGLKWLVMLGYGSMQKVERVQGGPPWTDSDQFDISAQVDPADMAGWDKLSFPDRMDRMAPMVQTLLEQRFQLKGHTAMVTTPVYVLEQAKGGSKLHQVPAPTAAELQAQQQTDSEPTDTPQLGLRVSPAGWVGHAVKIPEIVGALGYVVGLQDKPLLNQTGLTGYYDLTLKVVKQENGPTPEQQMEQQLGLRLEPRNVSMNTYVIDSVEKPTMDAGIVIASSPVGPPPLPHIHFDVVSWKRCAPGAKGNQRIDMPLDGDMVAYHCQPVRRVIYFAYTGPAPFELSGHPSWVDDDPYEFQAKVLPADIAAWKALTVDQRRLEVRDVLADQLKLQLHVDKTPQPAYALSVGKKGAKLTEYKVGEQWKIPDGRVLEGRQHVFIGDVIYLQNSDMNNLASNLSARLDHPVIDRTSLTDSYDITLPLPKAGNANPFANTGEEEGSVESGLEQLGLKLVPTKMEADGLVVDHIERPPEN